jgi:SAM-dependent methyltransferase
MDPSRPGGLSPDEYDYYSDGAWYDAEYSLVISDIPYYAEAARRTAPGRILELACGTGRLTIPMAKAGASLLGVDLAPAMIAHANLKRERLSPDEQARLRFMVDDMRALRLGEQFDAVVLAFNTIMHMTEDADLAAVLETVRLHLKESGRFYFDLHAPHPATLLKNEPSARYEPQRIVDPRTGQAWVISENNSYDAKTQINTMRYYYQRLDEKGEKVGPEREQLLRLRVLFARELDRWLDLAGFAIVEEWDDYARTRPFSGEGTRRIGVAALKSRRAQ